MNLFLERRFVLSRQGPGSNEVDLIHIYVVLYFSRTTRVYVPLLRHRDIDTRPNSSIIQQPTKRLSPCLIKVCSWLIPTKLRLTFLHSLPKSDSNGTITTAELGSVMRAVGRNPTEQDLQKILKEIDKDNSGSIEFDEFVELMERTFTDQGTPDELLQAFNLFDKDGSGKINISELGQVMESLG